MSASEENDNNIQPGMADDANKTNNVADNDNAAPPAAEAAVGGVRGNNTVQENNNAMMDLSPYFNTLIDTLHRNNDNQQNAAAAAGGTNNNNAPQLRSMMVSLLWNGVELIATAGRASLGQQGALFAVDTIGGSSGGNSFPSKFAAVYLYAVAQNIVALEEVVLQNQGSIPGAGLMDLADVGMSIKQVAEIVSVSVVVVVMKLVSSNMCARVF